MQESLAHPAPQTDRRVCVLSPHRKATLLKCFERVSKLSDVKGLRFGRVGNNASKKKNCAEINGVPCCLRVFLSPLICAQFFFLRLFDVPGVVILLRKNVCLQQQ